MKKRLLKLAIIIISISSVALSCKKAGSQQEQDTTPAAPTGLVATQGTVTDAIDLSWNTAQYAVKYYVYEATSATGTYSQLSGDVTTTGAVITGTGVSAGTHYFYKVSGVNSKDQEGPKSNSAEGWASTGGSAPATPTGLAVGSPTSISLYISWTASTGATSYTVQRAMGSPSGFSTIYTGPSTYFTDSGLFSSTTYYYQVAASNGSGTSAYSTPVSGTTTSGVVPPATPTGLYVSSNTATALTLSWDSVSTADTYQLFRDTSSGGSFTSQVYSGSSTYYTDNLVALGTYYYYKVQASNSAGPSASKSAYVSAVPTGTIAWVDDGNSYIRWATNDSAKLGTVALAYITGSYMSTGISLSSFMHKVSGNSTQGYGVIFNYIDGNNYMRLLIDTTGYYTIQQVISGSVSSLVAWKYSSHLYTGFNSSDNWIEGYYYYSNPNYYFQFYLNTYTIEYLYNTGGFGGLTGFIASVASSESFPGTPEDMRFQQLSPVVVTKKPTLFNSVTKYLDDVMSGRGSAPVAPSVPSTKGIRVP
jgi:fibronectin type 3 domain-containing protein